MYEKWLRKGRKGKGWGKREGGWGMEQKGGGDDKCQRQSVVKSSNPAQLTPRTVTQHCRALSFSNIEKELIFLLKALLCQTWIGWCWPDNYFSRDPLHKSFEVWWEEEMMQVNMHRLAQVMHNAHTMHTMHNTQCTLHTAHCTLYNAQTAQAPTLMAASQLVNWC